jgi:hypothetical protein
LTGLHHHHHQVAGHVQQRIGGSPSDEHSLPSSDIGEVDLDLWDLDINGPSVSPQSSTGGGHSPAVPPGRRSSDTSSTSGPFFQQNFSFVVFTGSGRWHTGFWCVWRLWFGKGRRHGNPALSSNREGGGKEGNVCGVAALLIFLIFQGRRHLHSTFSFGRLTNRVCLCESKTTFQSCGFS